jgi:hypothetical protein
MNAKDEPPDQAQDETLNQAQDEAQDQAQDEAPDTDEPSWLTALRQSTASRRPRVSLRERAGHWDAQYRSNHFVPEAETVKIDVRRHPLLLLVPGLRTLAGLLALASGLSLLWLFAFLAVTAVWAQLRLQADVRRTGIVAVGSVMALTVLTALFDPLLAAVFVLVWFGEDLADWYSDRLVVSDKRIYRRHGVLIRHSPSIALTAIAYLDTAVLPVGHWWTAGTLRLDSVAQRDAPLSRFDLIPGVVAVSHKILGLRTEAIRRHPPQVY